jgi:hypothetical protein
MITTSSSAFIEEVAASMVVALCASWRRGAPIYTADGMWEAMIEEPHPNGGTVIYPVHYKWHYLTPHIQEIYQHARIVYRAHNLHGDTQHAQTPTTS